MSTGSREAVIRTLARWNVTGHRVASAPGIYVRLDAPFSHAALTGPAPGGDPFRGLGKISALGIKVHRHCTYGRPRAQRRHGPGTL